MDGKQRGFTLIEILVVVTIIGVLAGLVVVLIPKGKFEANKTECINNCRNLASLITGGKSIPRQSGPNLLLYYVKKGDIEGEDNLSILFCPGDVEEDLKGAGGEAAYADIDLNKSGEYDHMTSYAGRDQKNAKCAVKGTEGKAFILVCDDSEDHHDKKGFCVGLTGGNAKFKDKFEDWDLSKDTAVAVGEGSTVKDLECLKRD